MRASVKACGKLLQWLWCPVPAATTQRPSLRPSLLLRDNLHCTCTYASRLVCIMSSDGFPSAFLMPLLPPYMPRSRWKRRRVCHLNCIQQDFFPPSFIFKSSSRTLAFGKGIASAKIAEETPQNQLPFPCWNVLTGLWRAIDPPFWSECDLFPRVNLRALKFEKKEKASLEEGKRKLLTGNTDHLGCTFPSTSRH